MRANQSARRHYCDVLCILHLRANNIALYFIILWFVHGVGVMRIKQEAVIVEGPRDALSQVKSCHLLRNCTQKLHLKRSQ